MYSILEFVNNKISTITLSENVTEISIDIDLDSILTEANNNDNNTIKDKLKKKANENLERAVDEITETILKDKPYIEIPGYGKLTKQKIKDILTKDDERKKFLLALGFPENYININKNLAERVLKGEITFKDAFNYLIKQASEFMNALLGKYGTKEQIKALGKLFIQLILLGIYILFISFFSMLLSYSVNTIIAAYILYIIVLPALTELFVYISTKLNTDAIMINATSLSSGILTTILIQVITGNAIISFLALIINYILNLVIGYRSQKYAILQKIGNNTAAYKTIIENLLLRILGNFLIFTGANVFLFFKNLLLYGFNSKVFSSFLTNLLHPNL